MRTMRCDNNSKPGWFKVRLGYDGPYLDFCSNQCASEWFARKAEDSRPVIMVEGAIVEERDESAEATS